MNVRDLIGKNIDSKPSGSEASLLCPWIHWYVRKKVLAARSPHTVDAKIRDLQKFVDYFLERYPGGELSKWDPPLSTEFQKRLAKDFKSATVYRVMSTLSHLSKLLIRHKAIDVENDPLEDIDPPTIPQVQPRHLQTISEDGVEDEGRKVFERLLEAVGKKGENSTDPRIRPYRDVAILTTLYHTGLRASELCSLKMAQMDPHKKTGGAYIRDLVGKGGKGTRDVYLDKEAYQTIKKYIKEERPNKGFYVFMSHNGKILDRTDIWRIVARSAKLAKLDLGGLDIYAHPHSFRHERIYNLLKHLPATDVIRQVGQKDPRQLMRYSTRSDEETARVLEDIK